MTQAQYNAIHLRWKRKKEQLKNAYQVIQEFEALDYVMTIIKTDGYKNISPDYMTIFKKDFGLSAFELCGEEE